MTRSEKVGWFLLQNAVKPEFSLIMTGAPSVMINKVYEWEETFPEG
jgi:hypothetical protein